MPYRGRLTKSKKNVYAHNRSLYIIKSCAKKKRKDFKMIHFITKTVENDRCIN